MLRKSMRRSVLTGWQLIGANINILLPCAFLTAKMSVTTNDVKTTCEDDLWEICRSRKDQLAEREAKRLEEEHAEKATASKLLAQQVAARSQQVAPCHVGLFEMQS